MWRSDVTLTADARQQLSDSSSIVIGPKTQLGGGIEYRGIPFLPIRVGAGYITGGTALAAGFGIRIRAYELGVGGSIRQGDAKGSSAIVTLFSIR